jgi:hypothetical protein
MARQRGGVVILLAALFWSRASFATSSAEARADESPESTTRACIDANEKTQLAEHAGRLREARELARSCAAEACPALVRDDCTRLGNQLDASIPSLLVEIREAGSHLGRVRVAVDGSYRPEALAGRSIELDPGVHHVRLEDDDEKTVEEREVVLRQGERDRRVVFDAPAKASAPSRAAPPLATYVLAGVTVAAGATFAIFGLTGEATESRLAGSCAPRCTSHDLAPLHTQYLAANLSLGVAVVALAATVTMLWLGRPSVPPGHP